MGPKHPVNSSYFFLAKTNAGRFLVDVAEHQLNSYKKLRAKLLNINNYFDI